MPRHKYQVNQPFLAIRKFLDDKVTFAVVLDPNEDSQPAIIGDVGDLIELRDGINAMLNGAGCCTEVYGQKGKEPLPCGVIV